MGENINDNQVGMTLETEYDDEQKSMIPNVLPLNGMIQYTSHTSSPGARFHPIMEQCAPIPPDSPSWAFQNMHKKRMLMDPLYAANSGFRHEKEDQEVNTRSLSNPSPFKNVLVVDDSPVALKVISRLISELGMVPFLARNGREAVQHFHEKGNGFFDIVLMDIQMPLMNGYEAIKIILSEEVPSKKRDIRGTSVTTKARHLIAMTDDAKADTVSKERAFRAGFEYFVTKPITSDVIKEFIRGST